MMRHSATAVICLGLLIAAGCVRRGRDVAPVPVPSALTQRLLNDPRVRWNPTGVVIDADGDGEYHVAALVDADLSRPKRLASLRRFAVEANCAEMDLAMHSETARQTSEYLSRRLTDLGLSPAPPSDTDLLIDYCCGSETGAEGEPDYFHGCYVYVHETARRKQRRELWVGVALALSFDLQLFEGESDREVMQVVCELLGLVIDRWGEEVDEDVVELDPEGSSP